jgi:pyruvate dehydrogenase E2 component (dihydrolipoamide acetyltransferase)
MDVTIPEISETTDHAEVARVLVAVGDHIDRDEPLLELESDKASFELPSPVAGTVEKVAVEAGDEVKVGQLAFRIRSDEGSKKRDRPRKGARSASPAPDEAEVGEAAEAKTDEEPRARQRDEEPKGERKRDEEDEAVADEEAVEVDATEEESDEGEKQEIPKGESHKRGSPKGEKKRDQAAEEGQPSERGPSEDGPSDEESAPSTSRTHLGIGASPSLRKRARELGVDLATLARTGDRVTHEDVEAAHRATTERAPQSNDRRNRTERSGGSRTRHHEEAEEPASTPPDATRFGPVEVESLGAVRRAMARHLTESWRSIPHVTQHELCDVTELERARKRYLERLGGAAVRLTLTAITAKALGVALAAFPWLNSSYDAEEERVIIKRYLHLGVAVDTARGLVVPVVRDAHRMSLRQIAQAIDALAASARAGKLEPRQLAGASFTITNLGALGGSFFTPILPPGQVAILGLSQARRGVYAARAEDGDQVLLPLSLTFDHRVVDGALAVRFLNRLSQLLADPLALMAA